MSALPDVCLRVPLTQVASGASLSALLAPPGGYLAALLALLRVCVRAIFRPARTVPAERRLLGLEHDCHATS